MDKNHVRQSLEAQSEYINQEDMISGERFRAGDDVVICRINGFAVGYTTWQEIGHKCPYCNREEDDSRSGKKAGTEEPLVFTPRTTATQPRTQSEIPVTRGFTPRYQSWMGVFLVLGLLIVGGVMFGSDIADTIEEIYRSAVATPRVQIIKETEIKVITNTPRPATSTPRATKVPAKAPTQPLQTRQIYKVTEAKTIIRNMMASAKFLQGTYDIDFNGNPNTSFKDYEIGYSYIYKRKSSSGPQQIDVIIHIFDDIGSTQYEYLKFNPGNSVDSDFGDMSIFVKDTNNSSYYLNFVTRNIWVVMKAKGEGTASAQSYMEQTALKILLEFEKISFMNP